MSLRDKLRARIRRKQRIRKIILRFKRRRELAQARRAHGRFVAQVEAIRKLKTLIRRALSIAPGPPAWGGSRRIFVTEVRPLVKRWGYSRTSSKRRVTFGNPASDHYWLNVYAFADDYATVSNFALAEAIRRDLTGDPNAQHRDYENFYIRRRGHTYRVQIIGGTHGTGPHLHVGIERVS